MSLSNSLKSVALISVTAAATALLIQACGGGANADTRDAPDAFEGVWQTVVSVRDCTSGTVLIQFVGQSVVNHGGTLVANSTQPPNSGTSALGVWQRDAGSGAYKTNMIFIRFNDDGSPAGTQTVSRTVTLSADAKTFNSTITNQRQDLTGAVVGQGCAIESGQRVSWP